MGAVLVSSVTDELPGACRDAFWLRIVVNDTTLLCRIQASDTMLKKHIGRFLWSRTSSWRFHETSITVLQMSGPSVCNRASF